MIIPDTAADMSKNDWPLWSDMTGYNAPVMAFDSRRLCLMENFARISGRFYINKPVRSGCLIMAQRYEIILIFEHCEGASAPWHPRQRDFCKKLKQRGRPTRPSGVVGMPLIGAVSVADWGWEIEDSLRKNVPVVYLNTDFCNPSNR